MKKALLLTSLLVLTLTGCGPKWTSLFNGKDLAGWHQATGEAEYAVENGCITGTTHVAGGPNSFLVTDATYGDFILEFEYKLDEGAGNSGVQFRSFVNERERVQGYQYEIDPLRDRRFTGGVYEESVGWLYKLTWNTPARDAYKPGAWNKGRVEAVGNHIRTFVNGVPCADLLADCYTDGFIGLQVHAIRDSARFGQKVSWRKIRICTEDVAKYLTPDDPSVHQVNWIANTLSDRQKAEGWRLLWDGATTEGWRSARGPEFPDEGWTVGDGMLQVWENGGAESTHGGDIITVDQYENFWLSVDFKLTKGANSGIKYFVRPDLYNVVEASAIGCEFQLLDDKHHPDAHLGVNDNRTLGSLYDLIKADKSDAWYNAGQWNTAWVKVEGNHVEHWLNGTKIVEYERNCQLFNALVQCSKYKNWENFGNHKKGHILLQEHGNEAFFRNVLIKELPATPETEKPVATLSEADLNEGWTVLFDGTSLDAWQSVKEDKLPEQGWAIEDGVLVVNPVPDARGGDLMTKKAYGNFMFTAEFKLTEGANSGIKYFINPGTYPDPSIGCEFQVLDDTKHPDALKGVSGNRTAGSLYDLIRAEKADANFQLYDWNTALIRVQGNHVEHWLNGVKVVEYDRNSQEFDALVKYSKFASREGFGNFASGHILLQDHVDKVYFRNIRVKEL